MNSGRLSCGSATVADIDGIKRLRNNSIGAFSVRVVYLFRSSVTLIIADLEHCQVKGSRFTVENAAGRTTSDDSIGMETDRPQYADFSVGLRRFERPIGLSPLACVPSGLSGPDPFGPGFLETGFSESR